MIRLDARLKAIKAMVSPCKTAADIGCDHGYLICSLKKSGVIERGFACDLNRGPLQNAERTIGKYCLGDSIDTVLTDGLNGLPFEAIDTFIIAGMGGETISDIMLVQPWIFDSRFEFVLQPMTKEEKLRQELLTNGFIIEKEQAVLCDDNIYTVLRVKYTQRVLHHDEVSYYTGLHLENSDPLSALYLERLLRRLERRAAGLSDSRSPGEAAGYLKLAKSIRERMR